MESDINSYPFLIAKYNSTSKGNENYYNKRLLSIKDI